MTLVLDAGEFDNDDTTISPAPTAPPALLELLVERPGLPSNRPPRVVRTVAAADGISRVIEPSHPADEAPTRIAAPSFSDIVAVVDDLPPSSFDPPTRLGARVAKQELPTVRPLAPSSADYPRVFKHDIATIPAHAPLTPRSLPTPRREAVTLPSGEFPITGSSSTVQVAPDQCGIIRAPARPNVEAATRPSDEFRDGRYECISETIPAEGAIRPPRQYPSHTRILVPAGTRSLMRTKSKPELVVPYRITPVFPVLAPRRPSSLRLAALGLVSAFCLGHALYELARATTTFLVTTQML